MAFFNDIAERFKLLPALGSQLLKSAEAKKTAERVEQQYQERIKPTVETPKIQVGDISGGFFGDIAKQFNLVQPQEFVKPSAVKPQPFVSSLDIQKSKEREERIKTTLKEIARSFPREGAGAVMEVIERFNKLQPGSLSITPGAGEVLPKEKFGEFGPKAEKFLFGDRPVESITRQGEETLKGFGVPEAESKQFGLTTGLVFLGLDLLPPGGKDVLKLLAKANKADDVKKILFGLKGVDNAKITDEVVNTIAKTTDEKTIKGIVEKLKPEAKPTIPSPLQPLAQEARKYGSAKEFVKAQGFNQVLKISSNKQLTDLGISSDFSGRISNALVNAPSENFFVKQTQPLFNTMNQFDHDQFYKTFKSARDFYKSSMKEISNGEIAKSQLTDFYNQAVGVKEPSIPKKPQPLAQEATGLEKLRVEYKAQGKSAEEFVKAHYSYEDNPKIAQAFDEISLGGKLKWQSTEGAFGSKIQPFYGKVELPDGTTKLITKQSEMFDLAKQYGKPISSLFEQKSDIVSKLTDARDNAKFDFKLSTDKTQIEVNANGIKFNIPRGEARMADAQQIKVRQYLNALIEKKQFTEFTKENLHLLSDTEQIRAVRDGIKPITIADFSNENLKLVEGMNHKTFEIKTPQGKTIKELITWKNGQEKNVEKVISLMGQGKYEYRDFSHPYHSELGKLLGYSDKAIQDFTAGIKSPVNQLTKSQLTDFYNQVTKQVEVKAPSQLGKSEDILAKTKIGQIGEELLPKTPPIDLPPTTPLRATEALPLKETGEQYTARELSSDTLYQKTGIIESAAKEADIIAKEIPTSPTKWNRFVNKLGGFMTSFKEKIVSDWQRVKELKTEGMKLTSELTPYERRKLMAGRQTARLERAEEVVKSIDKDILTTSKKLKIKDTELQDEVFDYLKARHAPERNAALGEKAAGITTKEAGEITARLEKSPHATEIKRIADDLQKFHNETLDILYQNGRPEGVISKELYDLLKTKYKNHIPLQRVMETDDIAEVLSGRGLAVKGTGLKRAVGSEREVRDIMENVYTARTQAIQRVEKNIVDNETFNFVQDYIKTFPEQDLLEVVKAPAIGKTFDGKIITKQINSPDILQFQRNGKPAYIKINNPRLAVALRGVNREQLPAVMRYISMLTRWMSALVTRYSPEFALSNKIRDMQEAVVYMASQDGFKSAAKTGLRDPTSINDVKNFILGKETAGTRLYAQMIEDGGTTGGMALSTRKQIGETLQSIRSTNRNIVREGFKKLAESVDKWNQVFEDSTRLSAYKTALESGMSREKAAIVAKNVSIDFNEFGTWGPIINSLYMFSNASIQGSAKMIRAMKNPKVATAVVGTVGTAVFAANEWNDRVDPEWRGKVSKWDKLNGLNIVIPGTEEFYYISIPVSWGLKPIKVAMEYGTDILSGQTVGLEDATEGMFTAVMEGYNPVGGTDSASALTPSPIEPFIDIARNRQWTGGKLRPDWNKYAPASTQYFKDLKDSTTGRWLIAASQFVSETTGGRIEVSPADAEYILQQITGGPGKFTGKVFNSISAVGKGDAPEVRDIPFLSRVFRKTPEERFYTTKSENDIIKTLTEQERKRFYDTQEAEIVFEELKKMPVEQRKETYMRLKEEKPQIIERVNKIADDEEKNLTRLDRQILDLGVENGARAKYLFKVFKSAEPQERKDLYQEYLKKGIISDNVRKQLDYLFTQKN